MLNIDIEISNIIDKSFDITPEQFIQSILDKVVEKRFKSHPDTLFYFIDNNYYFETNNNYNYLYCRYPDFWQVLEEKYSLTNKDIITFIKNKINNKFNCNIGNLIVESGFHIDGWVDNNLK